jgi:hypothetical protein
LFFPLSNHFFFLCWEAILNTQKNSSNNVCTSRSVVDEHPPYSSFTPFVHFSLHLTHNLFTYVYRISFGVCRAPERRQKAITWVCFCVYFFFFCLFSVSEKHIKGVVLRDRFLFLGFRLFHTLSLLFYSLRSFVHIFFDLWTFCAFCFVMLFIEHSLLFSVVDFLFLFFSFFKCAHIFNRTLPGGFLLYGYSFFSFALFLSLRSFVWSFL